MDDKIKEFILKEMASDKRLEELWPAFLEKRYSVMIRHVNKLFEKSKNLKPGILPDVSKVESDQHFLKFIESWIKSDLQSKIKKRFANTVNEEEFEIAYLEAKEDYLKEEETRGTKKIGLKRIEYEEGIDLEDENCQYNLLGLEIDYVNDAPKVILKLLSKARIVKAKEVIEEFKRSERNFAFLFRLAVAVMVNEERKEGWLHKYEDLYIKKTEPPRDTELGEFRKFLGNCEIPFLDEIAKSKNLDKEEFKKKLIRTNEYDYPASVRLAIPNINIDKETIDNLRQFKCKFISPKRLIKLPKETIRRIKGSKEILELEEIPVVEVVYALIRDACKVYDRYFGKSHSKLSKLSSRKF